MSDQEFIAELTQHIAARGRVDGGSSPPPGLDGWRAQMYTDAT